MVEWKKILHQKSSKSRRQLDSTTNTTNNSTATNVYEDVVIGHDETSRLVESKRQISTQASIEEPSSPPPVVEQPPPKIDIPQPPLESNRELLPENIRDYYYPDLDMDSAKRLLQTKPPGTFLLRHSQCPEAMYTLSVKSDKHVFNVRIFQRLQADNGYHLDAPKHLRRCFPSISELLRHYSNSPRELIALCSNEGVDEKTTFRLMYPLSQSESTLNLAGTSSSSSSASAQSAGSNGRSGGNDQSQQEQQGVRPGVRPVSRQVNGGSLKAMVKWL